MVEKNKKEANKPKKKVFPPTFIPSFQDWVYKIQLFLLAVSLRY